MAEKKKEKKAAAPKEAPKAPKAPKAKSAGGTSKLQVVSGVQPSAALSGKKFPMPAVHQSVVRQQANYRRGTHKTKGVADVAGSGAKPWKQKGSGRARVGMKRSPLWRGGGQSHSIKPHGYSFEMPRQMRRLALNGILSEKAREGALTVVEALEVSEPRTRQVAAILDQLGVKSAVFVASEPSKNFVLAARNIPGVKVLNLAVVNPIDLIACERLVITKEALGKIEALAGGTN
ncbi:MAG: 50S ribosomal protein L4 [Bdellovibrionota bacterium]